MKTRSVLMFTVVVVAFIAAGCGHQSLPFDVSLRPTLPSANENIDGFMMDAIGLAHALDSVGIVVRISGMVEQPFFSVRGQLLEIGAADVQVFEYASQLDAQLEAARITPDGSIIYSDAEALSIAWVDTPHFYTSGRLIVLYVGRDMDVLTALASTLGEPFASGGAIQTI